MDPDLVRAFCQENTAEMNRLRAGAGAARASKEAELAKIRRDHGKRVEVILAGVPADQAKDRMIALDERRQQLEAELSAVPEVGPVRLRPVQRPAGPACRSVGWPSAAGTGAASALDGRGALLAHIGLGPALARDRPRGAAWRAARVGKPPPRGRLIGLEG
jgi:hypothetical protein